MDAVVRSVEQNAVSGKVPIVSLVVTFQDDRCTDGASVCRGSGGCDPIFCPVRLDYLLHNSLLVRVAVEKTAIAAVGHRLHV